MFFKMFYIYINIIINTTKSKIFDLVIVLCGQIKLMITFKVCVSTYVEALSGL